VETVLDQPPAVRDDRALAERFRIGDETAFAEIVQRHRKLVYSMARRLLGSHEDADEAAQVAFVRAWRARERFRGEASLATWLVRIVLNVAKSMGVRRAESARYRQPEAADPAENAEQRIHRRELRGRVRRAVDALPPRQREVVRLKAFSELTYREVADVMELSEGAVKAHFHQAVSNLRRRMAAESEEATR
jgi:RNA polymerase sigma-70 factor (ECF subfamily)